MYVYIYICIYIYMYIYIVRFHFNVPAFRTLIILGEAPFLTLFVTVLVNFPPFSKSNLLTGLSLFLLFVNVELQLLETHFPVPLLESVILCAFYFL